MTARIGTEESQNHRMLRVGRDLCGSSSPTPLPKLQLKVELSHQLSQECTERGWLIHDW